MAYSSNLWSHPSISNVRKVKHSYYYKAFLPVEEHTQLLPYASAVAFILHQYLMTFRPAGLSRDPHGEDAIL